MSSPGSTGQIPHCVRDEEAGARDEEAGARDEEPGSEQEFYRVPEVLDDTSFNASISAISRGARESHSTPFGVIR